MRLKQGSFELESKIQSKILNYLNTCVEGVVAYRVSATKRGVPDIIACHKGLFVAFELKNSKGGKVCSHQRLEAKTLLECRGFVFFVLSVEEVTSALEVVEAVCEEDFGKALRLLKGFKLDQPLYLELVKEKNAYS